MKNLLNTLGWVIVGFGFGFLIFLYFSQKLQNEHTEKMMYKAFEQTQQHRNQEIELAHVVENKSLKEKVRDGLKSVIGFFISLYTKL